MSFPRLLHLSSLLCSIVCRYSCIASNSHNQSLTSFVYFFFSIWVEYWYVAPSKEMSRSSLPIWMYLCRKPWYMNTMCFSKSLISNFMHKVCKIFVNFDTSWSLSYCSAIHFIYLSLYNREILFLNNILKRFPGGCDWKLCIILHNPFLIVSFPPILDMRETLSNTKGMFSLS